MDKIKQYKRRFTEVGKSRFIELLVDLTKEDSHTWGFFKGSVLLAEAGSTMEYVVDPQFTKCGQRKTIVFDESDFAKEEV